ncbi:MAG: hypothetical protein HYT43_01880 [Candidatus Taylorbacteria bacterium]|nr:hypothetical protein [Candidatus Taylorbacteria bacterium]
MAKKNQNSTTLQKLSDQVGSLVNETRKGFKEVNEKIEREIEGLAMIIHKRFAELEGHMNERFDEVDKRLNTVEALLASNRIERLEDKVLRIMTHLKLE